MASSEAADLDLLCFQDKDKSDLAGQRLTSEPDHEIWVLIEFKQRTAETIANPQSAAI